MTVAFTRCSRTTWTPRCLPIRRAWDAPASIRGSLVAVGLIFVELAVVTAIALFFSTFSTPILSAALTFGLWIAGHFNTDLRNFEQVVESPFGRVDGPRALLRAAELGALRRQGQVVHGRPVEAAYVALTIGYAA